VVTTGQPIASKPGAHDTEQHLLPATVAYYPLPGLLMRDSLSMATAAEAPPTVRPKNPDREEWTWRGSKSQATS
jgi:hypothetical protein